MDIDIELWVKLTNFDYIYQLSIELNDAQLITCITSAEHHHLNFHLITQVIKIYICSNHGLMYEWDISKQLFIFNNFYYSNDKLYLKDWKIKILKWILKFGNLLS